MKKITIQLFIVFSFYSSFAQFNYENGNMTDNLGEIKESGTQFAFFERFYEPQSNHVGLFGLGWGSNIETSLTVLGDYRILYRENGNRKPIVFYPENISVETNAQKVKEASNKIIEVAQLLGDVKNENEKNELYNQLSTNADVRANMWEKYMAKGLLKAPILETDLLFKQLCKQCEKVIKTISSGFIDSDHQQFDSKGRLVEMKTFHNKYSFKYNAENRISGFKDLNNNLYNIEYNEDNLVVAIKKNSSDLSLYYYHDNRHLYMGADENFESNDYFYNDNNLLSSIYLKDSKIKLTYDPVSKRVLDLNFIDKKDDSEEHVTFNYNEKSNDLIVNVSDPNRGDKTLSFFKKRNDYGELVTSKSITKSANNYIEKRFDLNTLQPTYIKQGDQYVNFTYNNRDLLIYKNYSSGKTIEVKYHDEFDKIIYAKSKEGTHQFQYDDDKNLTYALAPSGQSIRLEYDGKGNMVGMIGENGEKIIIENNANNRPANITVFKNGKSTGAVTIEYKDGQISNVDASNSEAQQILAAMFQLMTNIVKLPGHDLKF